MVSEVLEEINSGNFIVPTLCNPVRTLNKIAPRGLCARQNRQMRKWLSKNSKIDPVGIDYMTDDKSGLFDDDIRPEDAIDEQILNQRAPRQTKKKTKKLPSYDTRQILSYGFRLDAPPNGEQAVGFMLLPDGTLAAVPIAPHMFLTKPSETAVPSEQTTDQDNMAVNGPQTPENGEDKPGPKTPEGSELEEGEVSESDREEDDVLKHKADHNDEVDGVPFNIQDDGYKTDEDKEVSDSASSLAQSPHLPSPEVSDGEDPQTIAERNVSNWQDNCNVNSTELDGEEMIDNKSSEGDLSDGEGKPVKTGMTGLASYLDKFSDPADDFEHHLQSKTDEEPSNMERTNKPLKPAYLTGSNIANDSLESSKGGYHPKAEGMVTRPQRAVSSQRTFESVHSANPNYPHSSEDSSRASMPALKGRDMDQSYAFSSRQGYHNQFEREPPQEYKSPPGYDSPPGPRHHSPPHAPYRSPPRYHHWSPTSPRNSQPPEHRREYNSTDEDWHDYQAQHNQRISFSPLQTRKEVRQSNRFNVPDDYQSPRSHNYQISPIPKYRQFTPPGRPAPPNHGQRIPLHQSAQPSYRSRPPPPQSSSYYGHQQDYAPPSQSHRHSLPPPLQPPVPRRQAFDLSSYTVRPLYIDKKGENNDRDSLDDSNQSKNHFLGVSPRFIPLEVGGSGGISKGVIRLLIAQFVLRCAVSLCVTVCLICRIKQTQKISALLPKQRKFSFLENFRSWSELSVYVVSGQSHPYSDQSQNHQYQSATQRGLQQQQQQYYPGIEQSQGQYYEGAPYQTQASRTQVVSQDYLHERNYDHIQHPSFQSQQTFIMAEDEEAADMKGGDSTNRSSSSRARNLSEASASSQSHPQIYYKDESSDDEFFPPVQQYASSYSGIGSNHPNDRFIEAAQLHKRPRTESAGKFFESNLHDEQEPAQAAPFSDIPSSNYRRIPLDTAPFSDIPPAKICSPSLPETVLPAKFKPFDEKLFLKKQSFKSTLQECDQKKFSSFPKSVFSMLKEEDMVTSIDKIIAAYGGDIPLVQPPKETGPSILQSIFGGESRLAPEYDEADEQYEQDGAKLEVERLRKQLQEEREKSKLLERRANDKSLNGNESSAKNKGKVKQQTVSKKKGDGKSTIGQCQTSTSAGMAIKQKVETSVQKTSPQSNPTPPISSNPTPSSTGKVLPPDMEAKRQMVLQKIAEFKKQNEEEKEEIKRMMKPADDKIFNVPEHFKTTATKTLEQQQEAAWQTASKFSLKKPANSETPAAVPNQTINAAGNSNQVVPTYHQPPIASTGSFFPMQHPMMQQPLNNSSMMMPTGSYAPPGFSNQFVGNFNPTNMINPQAGPFNQCPPMPPNFNGFANQQSRPPPPQMWNASPMFPGNDLQPPIPGIEQINIPPVIPNFQPSTMTYNYTPSTAPVQSTASAPRPVPPMQVQPTSSAQIQPTLRFQRPPAPSIQRPSVPNQSPVISQSTSVGSTTVSMSTKITFTSSATPVTSSGATIVSTASSGVKSGGISTIHKLQLARAQNYKSITVGSHSSIKAPSKPVVEIDEDKMRKALAIKQKLDKSLKDFKIMKEKSGKPSRNRFDMTPDEVELQKMMPQTHKGGDKDDKSTKVVETPAPPVSSADKGGSKNLTEQTDLDLDDIDNLVDHTTVDLDLDF